MEKARRMARRMVSVSVETTTTDDKAAVLRTGPLSFEQADTR